MKNSRSFCRVSPAKSRRFLCAAATLSVALFFLMTGCTKQQAVEVSEMAVKQETVPPAVSASGIIVNLASDTGGEGAFIKEPKYCWVMAIRDNEGVHLSTKADQLLLSGQDGWYGAKSSVFTAANTVTKPWSEAGYALYDYRVDTLEVEIFRLDDKVVLNPLPQDELEEEASIGDWPYRWDTQQVIFAGGAKVMLLGTHFETGGGTYNTGWYELKLYPLSSVYPGATLPFSIIETKQAVTAAVRLSKENDRIIRDDRDLTGEPFITSRQQVDIESPYPIHRQGKWELGYPLAEEYTHQGNGSYFHSIVDILPTGVGLPEALGIQENSAQIQQFLRLVPENDFVVSTDGKLVAVVRSETIEIYEYTGQGLQKVQQAKIPPNAKIIGVEQLDGEQIKELNRQL